MHSWVYNLQHSSPHCCYRCTDYRQLQVKKTRLFSFKGSFFQGPPKGPSSQLCHGINVMSRQAAVYPHWKKCKEAHWKKCKAMHWKKCKWYQMLSFYHGCRHSTSRHHQLWRHYQVICDDEAATPLCYVFFLLFSEQPKQCRKCTTGCSEAHGHIKANAPSCVMQQTHHVWYKLSQPIKNYHFVHVYDTTNKSTCCASVFALTCCDRLAGISRTATFVGCHHRVHFRATYLASLHSCCNRNLSRPHRELWRAVGIFTRNL